MKTTMKAFVVFATFLLALTGCAGSQTKGSTGDLIDDATITTKVKTALLGAPDVKGTQISVETFKGTVQLSGFADNAEAKRRAEDLAKRVDGVKSVKNDILIRGKQ
ncbi:MAG: BON domain-containing protein [Burkholderiales bacterium]|nr:BON domain-containing protein [Burkholderiales bacterium]MDQ3196649.1 BON domain-containing protein [Pseudomonadota bacterium]